MTTDINSNLVNPYSLLLFADNDLRVIATNDECHWLAVKDGKLTKVTGLFNKIIYWIKNLFFSWETRKVAAHATKVFQSLNLIDTAAHDFLMSKAITSYKQLTAQEKEQLRTFNPLRFNFEDFVNSYIPREDSLFCHRKINHLFNEAMRSYATEQLSNLEFQTTARVAEWSPGEMLGALQRLQKEQAELMSNSESIIGFGNKQLWGKAKEGKGNCFGIYHSLLSLIKKTPHIANDVLINQLDENNERTYLIQLLHLVQTAAENMIISYAAHPYQERVEAHKARNPHTDHCAECHPGTPKKFGSLAQEEEQNKKVAEIYKQSGMMVMNGGIDTYKGCRFTGRGIPPFKEHLKEVAKSYDGSLDHPPENAVELTFEDAMVGNNLALAVQSLNPGDSFAMGLHLNPPKQSKFSNDPAQSGHVFFLQCSPDHYRFYDPFKPTMGMYEFPTADLFWKGLQLHLQTHYQPIDQYAKGTLRLDVTKV